MSAGRVCSRVVATASPVETVRVAAQRMAEHGVGTLVVVNPDRNNQAIGVTTDRDIAIRCVAAGLDPEHTPVTGVMTSPAQTIDQDTPIETAVARMANTATRRLVVTGEGRRLVGILSLDDIVDLLAEEAGSIGRLLQKQRPRIPA
ncbi:MAG TPA: CBS domain-containing protein [Gemmatimonadales bacterium]